MQGIKGFRRLLPLLVCLLLMQARSNAAVQVNRLLDASGRPFSGSVSIKAAVVGGGIAIWSNDGSVTGLDEPLTAFQGVAVNGEITVILGAPPQRQFFPEALSVVPSPYLRVWVDIGEGYRLISERPVTVQQVTPCDDSRPQTATTDHLKSPKENTNGLTRSREVVDQKIERKKSTAKVKRDDYARDPGPRFREEFRQRADANGLIPMNGLLDAKVQIDEMVTRKGARDAGIWQWEWLGPGDVGGRIRAILVDPDNPNTMWIGSVSGGIWKTTNGGESWAPINDFLPSLAITSIVMDAVNHDVMYASTGEGFINIDALFGAGIFKSTDRGNTWVQLASTNNLDFRWVNRLATHPTRADTIFAVTNGTPSRVWRSGDGGATWQPRWTLNSAGTDIDIHPTNPNRILVGCADHLYYSDNGSVSFTLQTTGAAGKLPTGSGRCEAVFCPTAADRYYVAMERNGGELWRSNDAGQTWTLQNTGSNFFIGASNQGWYDNALWVNPVNADFLVVGGIDLWRSTNGGVNFEKISQWVAYHVGLSAHADHHIIVHHPGFNGSTNKRVYVGNDGGIQTATDIYTVSELLGWTNLANNLGITQFYGGAAEPTPEGGIIIGGTQDNSVLQYQPENGWMQWTTGDCGFCIIDASTWPFATLISEHPNLAVIKGQVGGIIWTDAVNGLTDNSAGNSLWMAPLVAAPDDKSVVFAGGRSIWKSENHADLWTSVRPPQTGNPLCSAIDVVGDGSGIVWVGYDNGDVAKSTDGGNTWTEMDDSLPGLPNRWVTDIAIHPIFHDQVAVTFSGFNSNNVWITTTSGEEWIRRTGTAPDTLPELQVNTVRWHPTNRLLLYIGTDLGVFASDDEGKTWSTATAYPLDNEGPVHTRIDELFWESETFLYAATHGRGMYRCQPHAILYVDPAGPINGNGSAAAPFRTITEAINAAGHGTWISIKGGTYNEAPVVFSKKGTIIVTTGPVIIE